MAITELIGNALAGLIEVKGSPVVTRTAAGIEVKRIYRCAEGSVTGALPAFGTADATYTGSLLREVVTRELKPYPVVELIYRSNGLEGASHGSQAYNGQVIYESDTNITERPIEQSESWSASWLTSKAGVESFLVPQPTWRKVSYTNSLTLNESTIIGNVGKIEAPTGLESPTSGKWLNMGKVIRTVGDLYEITETWQYYDRGWDTDMYDEA